MSRKSRAKYLAMAAMFLCSQLLPLQVLAGNGFYGYNVKPNVFIKQQFAPGFVKPQFNPGFVKPQFNPGFVKPQFNPGFVKPQFNPGFVKPNVFIQQQFAPGFAKPNAFIPKQFTPGGFGNAKANFGFGFKNVQGVKQWQGISPAVYSLGGAGKFAGQNFGAFAGFKNAQAFAGKSPVFGMIRPSKFNGANFPASFKTFNGGIPTNPFKALNGAGFANPLKTFNGVPNHHAEQWSFAKDAKPIFIGKSFSKLEVGALVHPQFEFTGNGEFPAGFSLDLGSRNLVAVANISAPMQILVGGYLDGNGNVSGGMPMVVNPGQLLTPAQYAALDQIAETGHQSLVLTKHGVAATGFLTLEPSDVSALGNLAVPRMVTVSGVGFTPEDPFVVNGGAFVVGNVYASQNTPNAASVMQLGSLAVGPHGMVSGAASTSPGLAGRVFSSASLALEVAGDVFNQGMITNPGILNIRAGGSITNQSVAGMPRATISGSEVNLFTGSGQLNNSGLIAATAGNLFINAAPTRDLIINNHGGAMEALNGAINFRTPAYNGTANINFNGGDLTARSFTFSSGKGTVDILANSLNGITNINACNAHLTTANNILNLGNMNLSGDPSFYNFGGPINVSGALNFAGQALALISSTNINFLAGSSISTANAAGAGGHVVIIAGANANPVPGNNPVLPPGAGDTTTTVTLSGPSATGGTIDMSGLGSFTSTGSTNGGSVTLAATAGSTVGSGRIIAPAGLTINTGGGGAGTNGAVNVFAGATTGTAITMGNVNTTGGTGGGGGINIQTATPNGLNGLTVLNGAITSGSITPGTVQAASVTTGTLTAPGATVAVTGGQNVQTGLITNNGTGANPGGTVNLTASAASTNGTLTAVAINANGGATGNGGTVNLINNSSGLLSVNGTINANGGATSGNGGSITVTNTGAAGANGGITVASAASLNANATLGGGGSATINAGGATPGALTFGGGGAVVSANGGGPAGGAAFSNGGNVNVTGRTVALTAGLQTFRANGASSGNGGTVSLTTLGNTGDITVGAGAAGLQFSATGGSAGSAGGNAGSINLSAGRNLTDPAAGVLTVTALGNAGNGGTVNLTASTAVTNGTMNVGAITANGAAVGNGGNVILTNNSSGLLTVGSAISTSAGATSGNGGQIIINNLGAGGANGGISVANNLTANSRGGITPGAITVNAGGLTPGNVTIAGSFNANAVGAATNTGGNVQVTGQSITINGNNRVFSGNGAGAGNGGFVNFQSLGAAGDITAAGTGLQFRATGGSAGSAAGSGGTVTLTAARNLSIPAASTVNVNAIGNVGNAGNVNLTASNVATGGTMNTGVITANGAATGNGGTVTLTNNSSGLLTSAGAISANSGATSGTRGSITLTNLGAAGTNGGITVSNTVTSTGRTGTGGGITVNAGGGTPGAVSIGASFNANGVTNAAGGNIGITGRTITVTGNNRTFTANGAGTSNGGSVSFTALTNTGDISAAGTGLQFTATGGSAASAAGSGGTVTFSAGRNLSLAPTSIVNVNALGAAGSAGNATLTASTVATDGTLNAGVINANGAATGTGNGGVVSITNNSSGLLTAAGAINTSAGATSGASGSITITNLGSGGANGGITVSNNLTATRRGNAGGNIEVNSGGGTPGAVILAGSFNNSALGAATANGGAVLVTGRSITINGNNRVFSANGAGAGNGGSVQFTSLGATGDISGTGTGMQFTATGGSVGSAAGNGGTVSLSAAQTLGLPTSSAINVSALGTNGIGGNATLTASTVTSSGNLTAGAITANGAANGQGGVVSVTNNSTGLLTLGGTINANGGSTSGNGGTIGITNTGAAGANGGITVISGASLNANAPQGSGGSVMIHAGGATPGALTFGGGGAFVSANGGGAAGSAAIRNGGTVTVTGRTLAISGAGVRTFRANGASSGNGGTVSVTALGNTGDITVGSGGAGLQFLATGGSAGSAGGNGGTISLSAGRNLTSPAAGVLTVSALGNVGNGGNVNLTASTAVTNGTLAVGAITANGAATGNGGTINLTNNSSGALSVNNTVNANGGATSGNGGTITVTNTGAAGSNGGVVIASAASLNANATQGNGGTVTINVGGATPGAITFGGGGAVVSANGGGAAGGAAIRNGGTISITGRSVAVTAGLQTFRANAASSGNGGTVSVTALGNTGDVTVGSGATGLQFSATGGSAGSAGGNGGTLSLSAGRNLTSPAAGVMNVNALGNVGNGGTLNLAASTAVTNGTLTVGTLTANAAATGTGGIINLTSNSSSTIALNNTISVNGGTTAGNGGTLTVTNTGAGGTNGGISIASGVSQNANATVGSGGSITLNAGGATPGNVTFGGGGGVVSANGGGPVGGAGVNSGGTVSVTGQNVNLTAGSETFRANGASSGNGGTVSVSALGATGDITIGVGATGLLLSATGGSAGSNAGNGGTINITAGRNVTIPGAAVISTNPLGNNGTGGNISLVAGATAASGQLKVSQALSANGVGTGGGGNINISYRDTNPLIVGAAGANSFITGNITANAAGAAATGGTVTISNTAASALDVTLNGTISANATLAANLGNINFVPSSSAQAVSVVGPGNLFGKVNATAASVNINPQAAGTTLTAGQITSTSGAINLAVNGNTSQVVVATGGNVTSSPTGTDVTISGQTVTSNGLVSSNRDLTINADNLAANGNMTTTRDLNIAAFTVGGPLAVTPAVGISLTAGRDVNFGLGNPGQITVTGGNISAGAGTGNVLFNGGNQNVNVNVNTIAGGVTGSANAFSVTVQNGNLLTRGIDVANTNPAATVSLTAQNGSLTISGDIGNSITPVNTTSLTSFNDLQSGSITGTVFTNTLNLTSLNGNINGTSTATPFLTNAANVTANAAGSVFISDSASGVVSLGTSSAGSDFNFIATNASTLQTTGTIDTGNTNPNATVSLTAQLGSLAIGANIGNNVTPVGITSLTSFNDLQSASITGTIFTNTLNLTSLNGNINGSSTATPFLTNAANVTANAAGSAFISDSASGVVSLGTSSAGSDFNFIATNASTLQTTGTIDAGNTNPNATVSLTAQAGSLTIGANIGNNTTPIGTTSLTSFNDLQSASITGTIFTNALNLTSLNGNINGSSTATPFLTNAASVTANAAGSAFISDSASGVISLGTSSAGSDFNFIATNASTLQTTGTIDAGNTNPGATVALTAQAGTLLIGANIGNSTTPIGTTSLTSFNDLQSANITGTIFTNTLNLTSLNGNINGSSTATPFSTNAVNVTANAAGSAFISDSASGVVSLGTSSAGSDFNFIATNASTLQTTGTIDAGNTNPSATVSLTAQAGSLTIGANIGNNTTPVATTSLTSFNDLQSASITGTIFTNTLNLTSLNGNINGSSTATPFLTNAANVTANAAGSAFISDSATGVVSLGTSSAGSDFNFIATNASTLQTTGTIDAGNTNPNATVSLTAQLGSLAIGANIGNNVTPVGITSLTSFNDLQSASITGTIFTNTLNLTSLNGNINGSSTATPFLTNAANVTANAAGSAFISDSASGVVSLGTSSAGSDFNFIATNASTLQTTGTIDAGNTNPNATVSLTAQLGSLAIGANIGNNVTPVGITSLTSFNDLQSASITGTIFTNTLNLTSTNGNINGSSTATPFLANAANASANAAGSVFISDSAIGTVTINNPSSAGGDFQFVTTNASLLQTTATIDAANTNPNATVSLISQAGSLTIGAQIGNNTVPLSSVTLNASFVPSGNVVLGANVDSSGALTIASGNAGAVTINNGLTITGGTVSVTTPTLNQNGILVANAGDLSVASNGAANALAVNLGVGSAIASAANVNFNTSGAPGSIQMIGGNGDISAGGGAGAVAFNGGTGAVNVDVNSMLGSVVGTGNPFNIKVETGNLTAGGISGGGAVTLDAGATAGGSVNFSGNVTANGTLNIIAGTAGVVGVGAGQTQSGNGVNITAPTVNNSGAIVALSGNLNVASNGASNALAVNLGTGAAFNAMAGDLIFNTTGAPGQITMLGQGDIVAANGANHLILNGGSGAVDVNIRLINAACIDVTGSSIAIQTTTGNLFFCQPLDTSSTTGSGGPVTVIANSGAVVLDNVNTNGAGTGNSAGTVTISSTNGVTVGQVTANGTGGAAGGVVNINAPNNPIHAVFIEATGSGSANGGSVNLTSDTLTLSGQNGAGNSLDTSALGTGTGGPLTVTTTNGAAPFIVGGGAGVNGTNGNIVSNGFSGGFIKLNNFGGWIVNSGAMILANGGGGDGGKIRFQNSLPAGSKPLVATINGFVQADNAANTTGRVGFNGGPGQNITLLGNGVVWGGEFVSAGNLDPETLELISPAAGIIKIDPNLTILNRFITNGTIPPNPQPIPISNPGSGSNSSVEPGATTVANLNAEVGTQISPLQGFVAFNQLSANALLPSTTATDITQIFNYSNLDQTAPPQLLGIGDGEEEGAMIDGARTFAGTFESQEMARLSKEGIKLASNSGSNYLNLDKGNVFFHPDKSIVVGTHEGDVYIAANACVFVMESGNDVAVYDLHQSRPGQVTVISGKKKLTLEPGRMLVLTRQNTRDFEEVKGDFRRIGYRRSSELDIDQSVKAFAADFSIPSAVNMIRPIKTMLKSDQAQEQTAISRILKSSVILSDLTDAAGPFSNGDLGR